MLEGPTCEHRAPRFPDHSLDWFPLSVLKSNALGHLLQRLVHSLYVWLARGGTRVQPHRTFRGRSLTHCLYGQTVHPWLKRPTRYHMLHLELWPRDRRCIARFPSVSISFGYTLNLDLVTDAASRGFPVLACHLATPWDRRCIAWFPSVSMSFGYTLNFDLVTHAASRGFPVLTCHLTTPCDRRCIAWFPSVCMSFGTPWTLTSWPTLYRAVSQC